MKLLRISTEALTNILTRGVDEVIVAGHLRGRLESGRRLTVKFGIDPTAPELHLGHTVPLRKLKQLQECGHTIVLIIGDYTARIGDPSGRQESRRSLSRKEVLFNMKRYLQQAWKILNRKKTNVRYNSEWYEKEKTSVLFSDIMSRISIQRVLERDDFQKRLKENKEITMLETLYPLLQGYDSVVVKADLEIGGTDQKFNMLMGRRLQRSYGMPEQDIMTTPLLEGTDGSRKMSKSFGNAIPLDASPEDMFGKIMSLPDMLVEKYFLMCTDIDLAIIKSMSMAMREKDHNPRDFKMRLAREIVTLYHGEAKTKKAEDEFVSVFRRKELPEDVRLIHVKDGGFLFSILQTERLTNSISEARRLLHGRALKIGGVLISENRPFSPSDDGKILQIGKHRFYKIRMK